MRCPSCMPLSDGMRWWIALAISAVLAACGGGGDGSSGVASVTQAQDAMAANLLMRSQQTSCNYEHVYITVQAIRARQQGTSGDPWREVVLSAPRRIDLMNLGGGLLQALGAQPLEPGRYTEIRLVLADTRDDSLANAVQPAGGSLVPLHVPSGSASGLKLNGSFDVPASRSGDLLLQGSDPCLAVLRAGNSGRYQLQPQLNARLTLLPPSQELRLIGDEVAAVPGGGFLVIRRSPDALFLQRYTAQGELAGNEVSIGLQDLAISFDGTVNVTALAGGGYALSWLGPALSPPAFPPYPVMVRFYSASGSPLGAAQQIGTTQPFRTTVVPWPVPAAAGVTGGGFVIAWADPNLNVLSQALDAAGNPIGPNRVTGLAPYQIRAVALSSGGYMVVSGLIALQARAYAADGTEAGPVHTLVADTGWTPNSAIDIAVSALGSGGAVVTWFTATIDQPSRFFVQRVAADATPVGTPVEVSSDGRAAPAIAGLADGSFVVAWPAIRVRAFAPSGTALAPATQMNPGISADRLWVLPVGGSTFVVAWSGVDANGQRVLYLRLFPSLAALGA